ncbi:MAG: ABC transporter ATP-binding protein, partial [Acidobacteriota bacterium]
APDSGLISLDGTFFFRRGRPGPSVQLPARKRRVGYVFQNYALFPHLTALENVAFGLGHERERLRRAADMLERIGLAHVRARLPQEMSGGQQQRVALARALAPGPAILLLDEPFSALDGALRESLQADLRRLQNELSLIVVYVTHRLPDAFSVGRSLAVLSDGRVMQRGSLEEVFRRPSNDHVAAIMGIRNLLRARAVQSTVEGVVLDWDGLLLEAAAQPVTAGGGVLAYIQPEDIKLVYPGRPPSRTVMHNQMDGVIVETRPQAGYRLLWVSIENGRELEVHARIHDYTALDLAPGSPVRLSLRREALVILQPSAEPGPADAGPPAEG